MQAKWGFGECETIIQRTRRIMAMDEEEDKYERHHLARRDIMAAEVS